jgi:endonuclease YncB( thermonuclease family)
MLLGIAGCSLVLDGAPLGGGGGAALSPATPPPAAPPPEGDRARVVYVIDGDTIEVDINGARRRVRYVGINTPESDEACYRDATNANRALVEGQTVILVRDQSDTDRFNRLLRYIYLPDGTFVNERLVRDGWAEAVEYRPDTRHTARFRELEVEAARAGRGCHPTGIFNDGTLTR